jgi:hypothetical protein
MVADGALLGSLLADDDMSEGAMGSGTFAPLCKLELSVTGGQARCYSRKIEILAINIEGYTYF